MRSTAYDICNQFFRQQYTFQSTHIEGASVLVAPPFPRLNRAFFLSTHSSIISGCRSYLECPVYNKPKVTIKVYL